MMRVLMFATVAFTSVALVRAQQPVKKAIEFGWDIATPQYLRDHLAEMERTAFDGTILTTKCQHAGKEVTFEWAAWGSDKFAWEELAPSLAALREVKPTTLKHNFVRFNTTPGDVDWFDDFEAILHNCRLVARYAKAGGLEGICFDIEQYNSPLFDYRKQKYREQSPTRHSRFGDGAKSFEDYAFQARKRGRQVMQAFADEFPDVVILLMFGHSLPYVQAREYDKLAQADYGLLAPFLDGMLIRCPDSARIVDGYELSYPYKTRQQFEEGRRVIKELAPTISVFPQRVREKEECGFGIWMDYNSGRQGWHPEDFSQNHFSPQEFQQALAAALAVCDEYVWVYTERLNWWTQDKLPKEYLDALRRAKGR